MQDNRTVYKPTQPKFAINQTVYARVSATKGYIEPLFVHAISYDPYRNTHVYIFRRELLPTKSVQLIPARLVESQLVTLCEATDIQLSVLQRDYDKAVKLLNDRCSGYVAPPETPTVYEDPSTLQTKPPKPKFGYNEVVYLKESADSAGFLEAMRITQIDWDNKRKQWLYSFQFTARPEYSMPIGDGSAYRDAPKPYYNESELLTFCEAQQIVVNYLAQAIQNAQWRKQNMCADATGSTA
jgi:hypothetical protein